MRLPFRRPAEPVEPPLSKDQIIADLSRQLACTRDDLADAHNIIVYQNARMRDMAGQILGSQAIIARYQKVAETWTGVSDALTMSTVDPAESVVPHECRHATTKHGQWGCWEPGCCCTIPRHMLDKAAAS